MADAATDARESLDRVNETLKPGRGRIDLFAGIRDQLLGGEHVGAAVAGVEVAHRWSEHWSAFGRGTVGASWAGEASAFEAQALFGVRGAW